METSHSNEDANAGDESAAEPEKSGIVIPLRFPQKLMQVLDCHKFDDIIWWGNDGVTFWIVPKGLQERVIPIYFGEAKFESFRRKLHRWCFKRVKDECFPSKEIMVYHHPLFQRGKPEMLKKMRILDASHSQNTRKHHDLDGVLLRECIPLPNQGGRQCTENECKGSQLGTSTFAANEFPSCYEAISSTDRVQTQLNVESDVMRPDGDGSNTSVRQANSCVDRLSEIKQGMSSGTFQMPVNQQGLQMQSIQGQTPPPAVGIEVSIVSGRQKCAFPTNSTQSIGTKDQILTNQSARPSFDAKLTIHQGARNSTMEYSSPSPVVCQQVEAILRDYIDQRIRQILQNLATLFLQTLTSGSGIINPNSITRSTASWNGFAEQSRNNPHDQDTHNRSLLQFLCIHLAHQQGRRDTD